MGNCVAFSWPVIFATVACLWYAMPWLPAWLSALFPLLSPSSLARCMTIPALLAHHHLNVVYMIQRLCTLACFCYFCIRCSVCFFIFYVFCFGHVLVCFFNFFHDGFLHYNKKGQKENETDKYTGLAVLNDVHSCFQKIFEHKVHLCTICTYDVILKQRYN